MSAVASRARGGPTKKPRTASANRDAALPPAKKTKLTQAGYSALLNGTPSKKPQAKVNGAKNPRTKVADATAVVGSALDADVDMADADKEVIEISSAEEEESDYASSEDEQDTSPGAQLEAAPAVNGNGEGEDEAAADDEDLTFGDKLHAQDPELARAPRVVDVEAAFVGADAETRALATASNSRALAAPSATSLGTVLTQALRTNDKDLLDSCLRIIDVDTIYATVERLPSPLVGNLLQKLAERLYKKPGRAGILMVWVQWSLAAHGGYLASQPQLVKQLATLNKVLKERASGLQPLLSLKGRLDMLQAQLELRRRNQKKAAGDDEEEAVIYVEGEDDVSSGEEESDDDASPQKRIRQGSEEEDEESDDDMMPTTMEVDEDEDEDEDEDSDDLLDDEAEETDNDTGDDMSEPMSDDDLDDGEDVSENEEPQSVRRSTAGRAGIARRY
jgi:U3 small nucleolar RNA-associated protein 5